MNQPDAPLFSQFSQSYYFTEVSRPEPIEPIEPTSSTANVGWSVSVGSLVLISSLVLLMLSIRKSKPSSEPAARDQINKPLSSLLDVDSPCRHCHYFNASRFLPCAVNPMQVLTPEAADCTDFRAANKTP